MCRVEQCFEGTVLSVLSVLVKEGVVLLLRFIAHISLYPFTPPVIGEKGSLSFPWLVFLSVSRNSIVISSSVVASRGDRSTSHRRCHSEFLVNPCHP